MGEMVSFTGNGGTSEGYLAIPSGGAASPAVIVIQDWWGLVPHVRAVVDRFAEAGFVALAPDFRHGGPAVKPTEPRLMLNSSQMDEAASDIAAAAEYLASRSEVAGKVGCAGFCAGASLALWSGTFSERIVATAGFYPRLPWEGMATGAADNAGRTGAADNAGRTDWAGYAGKAALIHCSEADGLSAADGVQSVRRSIESAGGTCQTFDYPGTAHAFFNEDRPEHFDQRAAATAWARTLELFRAKLG
ncbi:dienelactone hydrolase family protein [Micromonospora aurantiaca]|uniref:Dienelactone hydrolase family protein n=1 Tax=Micromonospora aurantiaca (nom. illeg.) TaxID=47850 RepID=A0ABQ6ULV7_9ACTN|nr:MULTISPECIES: dienelactone hydrolase family protein [Micromonospora]ADU06685.1 dienelactone hydrolase [Micromonospora sp. L5]KAB1118133.1 dienelactone hydrolase family protein [Micromonospora aurantiaca]MBC9001239.1 dienelactone hydrolase family protein [Micromonospora aurantiaca]RNI05978.1 dienelactone hydrolase family protein [Micromonospora aurantiaca]UFN95473.1 dienelactone hydrolase family protein [Micromonospora aurantiaca]